MVRLLVTLTLAALALQASADEPKPEQPTARELAAGEVMLFDNATTYGWTIEGESSVEKGWLILGGKQATTATCTSAIPTASVKIECQYDSKIPAAAKPQVSLSSTHAKQTAAIGLSSFATDGEMTRIVISVPAGTTAKLGRVSALPHLVTMLLNGKDLEGWSINKADPKRMLSKWELTKEGELSLKNGPGDLVSDKQFDNFVLQLECKTLGKWLNSGVFFRCMSGRYQDGYECQIQNGYKGDDRTKPIDFGTGAIYRRIAARKVVSNDDEWFTMTIVADGKHFATWVNGHQTVDWTDDRPANDNPRNGYRQAKGPLSLQGHDATTDLLFRNIRITDFADAKK